MFELHQTLCLFLRLPAEKKTPFLEEPKQIFGPLYFVTVFLTIQKDDDGTMYSNGFYADISNQRLMQQYKSCLKSFL